MAELADALDSGSSDSNIVWVQVPFSAPKFIVLNDISKLFEALINTVISRIYRCFSFFVYISDIF